jgi:hypothetical protein
VSFVRDLDLAPGESTEIELAWSAIDE